MMSSGRKTERWILRFWGGLDAVYLLLYIVGSIRRGHLPVVTDLQSMLGIWSEQGLPTVIFMVINLVLQASIIFSAALLLGVRKAGIYFGLAQMPWRLLFSVPSLSVLLVWASLAPDYNPWLMFGLIVISEFIKGGSLIWALRRQSMHRRFAGS